MGELWGVYCQDSGENWECYNSTALYLLMHACGVLEDLGIPVDIYHIKEAHEGVIVNPEDTCKTRIREEMLNRKTSNISHTKSQYLNDSRLV